MEHGMNERNSEFGIAMAKIFAIVGTALMGVGALWFRFPYEKFYNLGADHSDGWILLLVPWFSANVLFLISWYSARRASQGGAQEGSEILLNWFGSALLVQFALLVTVVVAQLWQYIFIATTQHGTGLEAAVTLQYLAGNAQNASGWLFGCSAGIAILAILHRPGFVAAHGWIVLAATLAFFPWTSLWEWITYLRSPYSRFHWWNMLYNPLFHWGLGMLSGILTGASQRPRNQYWLGPIVGWSISLMAVALFIVFRAGEQAFSLMGISYISWRGLAIHFPAGLGSTFASAGLLLCLPQKWQKGLGGSLAVLGLAILTAILTANGIR